MSFEPALSRARGTFNGRWRWWYSSIADYRLAHPGCTNKDIAVFLNKGENTISAIVNTDLYKDYEAQRREEWRRRHADVISQKLTGVAIDTLDSIAAIVKKKGDQIPLDTAIELNNSVLDRLGFAPKQGPSVIVQQNSNETNIVQMPGSVTIGALEEARQALRAVEAKKLLDLTPTSEVEQSVEAEPEGQLSSRHPPESQGEG